MAVAATLLGAEESSSSSGPATLEFFETHIRPVLAEHCYPCHSSEIEKPKAGLRLDSRDAILQGGESGPAAVAGDPEHSLLVKAVRYSDPDLQMPPKKGRISEQKIRDLVTWIQQGLPWPPDPRISRGEAKRAFSISPEDKQYWAFCPIRRPPPPTVRAPQWPSNAIDAFILAELETKGITPNSPATPRELIRRVYFDLLGVPPPPFEVESFVNNPSAAAYANLVDRLLARPQYGERWGRYWLDVARFAQSNGYERDGEKPLAWRYRDYVIKALNEDKPYDRFVVEQIAGDELPDATADSVVATGFQRLGVWDDEPDDKAVAEFDELDDIVSTTGTAFLGLTLGCARCHDHKFDPISQTDYYQFLAFFRNVRLNENARFTFDSANYVPLAAPAEARLWQQRHEGRVQELESQVTCAIEGPEKRALQSELDKTKNESWLGQWALGVREHVGESLSTRVLIRGNPKMPGPEVQPAFLTVLGGAKPSPVQNTSGLELKGRRLALARWIASSDNPLTARVAVNRLWQHHFGQGIVKTPSDFGHTGASPTHPELLDWLASEFIGSGWSFKHLHRLILLSRTYQMCSRTDNEVAQSLDPSDNLLWRQRLHRLEAESLWDAALTVSGELNPFMGGRGFFPHLNGEVLAGESRPGLDWELSSEAERSRRSIYIYVRRTMLAPLFEAFDYNTTSSPLPERPVTTVAPQALMLLNSDWAHQRARAFAVRLARETSAEPRQGIERAYQLAFGRAPSTNEYRLALNFLDCQAQGFKMVHSRLTFAPDVPNALFADYLKQLRPGEFLRGPTNGWQYYRGRWSSPYEGIRAMDRSRGPFALWQSEPFTDATITAEVTLNAACESGSILFRSVAQEEEQRGYELQFDPRQQQVRLLRQGNELVMLASAGGALPVGHALPVRITISGPRVRVWLRTADSPVLDETDLQPVTAPGRLGVRSIGAPISFDHLLLETEGRTLQVWKSAPKAGAAGTEAISCDSDREIQERAWASFCLMLLNLNEFIYVD
jgi:hypothetical protein